MKFANTQVFNFENAFYGMRAPRESWDKSDSFFGLINLENDWPDYDWVVDGWIDQENITRRESGFDELSDEMEDYERYYDTVESYCQWMRKCGILRVSNQIADVAFLGPNDLELAQKLVRAGNEHSKFMRQIFVSVNISAPLLWWKEMDTYKVGTTANSTSTMHTLVSQPITKEMFEFDNDIRINMIQEDTIKYCEHLRRRYIDTKDDIYWRALIQMLPNAYIQTRTITMSYANIRNIYFQRKNHKLKEWHEFCDWVKTLPYNYELIRIGE